MGRARKKQKISHEEDNDPSLDQAAKEDGSHSSDGDNNEFKAEESSDSDNQDSSEDLENAIHHQPSPESDEDSSDEAEPRSNSNFDPQSSDQTELNPSGKYDGRFKDNATIFVGQLPKSVTSEQLRTLFKKSGEISRISIMKFRDTKKPMGSAFVEFQTEQAAQKAISRNGETYQGRRLRINLATNKPYTSKGKDPQVHSRERDQRLIYVGNLNFKTEKAQLQECFQACGKIYSIDLPLFRNTGKKRG
jgi:RNA recognition motif-containing protein